MSGAVFKKLMAEMRRGDMYPILATWQFAGTIRVKSTDFQAG
jgi:hypothetical protein